MKPKTKKLTKPGQVPKEGNYACINGEWVRTDKKRNASDSTMRNVKAANRRFAFLEHRIDTLCAALNDLRDLHARLQGDFITLDAWVASKLAKKRAKK